MTSLTPKFPTIPEGWEISKLRHETADVIVEIHWQTGNLTLIVDSSKATIEENCKDVPELTQHLERLFGSRPTKKMFDNWNEVTYRRKI